MKPSVDWEGAVEGVGVLAANGVAMVSSELPGILGMGALIYVMREARITGELDRSETTEERIMQYATGQDEEAI